MKLSFCLSFISAFIVGILIPSVGHSSGGFITGGGGGIAGCPIVEDCRFYLSSTGNLWIQLNEVIAEVDKKSPTMALQMREIINKKSWLMTTADLAKLSTNTIGIPISSYQDVKTLAIHTLHEVWISSTEFKQMNARSQLLLVIHEILVGIHFKTKFITKVPGLGDVNENFHFKTGEALTPTEYQGVRTLTTDLVDKRLEDEEAETFVAYVAALEFPKYRPRAGQSGYSAGQLVPAAEVLRFLANRVQLQTYPKAGRVAGEGDAYERLSRCDLFASTQLQTANVVLNMSPQKISLPRRSFQILLKTPEVIINYSDLEGFYFDLPDGSVEGKIQEMRWVLRFYFESQKITQVKAYPQIYQNIGKFGSIPQLGWFSIKDPRAISTCE